MGEEKWKKKGEKGITAREGRKTKCVQLSVPSCLRRASEWGERLGSGDMSSAQGNTHETPVFVIHSIARGKFLKRGNPPLVEAQKSLLSPYLHGCVPCRCIRSASVVGLETGADDLEWVREGPGVELGQAG